MEELIGTIKLFAGNFAPHGWLICDGRLLNITQNAALFSIIGTTYGGDGRTTFALPDLRGRVPVGFGQSQLPHESFRVVHLTKNYKPKQHQETQIIMLILNRKTSQQWLVFVFITKAFVSIEIFLNLSLMNFQNQRSFCVLVFLKKPSKMLFLVVLPFRYRYQVLLAHRETNRLSIMPEHTHLSII